MQSYINRSEYDLEMALIHLRTSLLLKSGIQNQSGDQNREHFPRTVMASMMHGVSQRALAHSLSAYAIDLNLASADDTRLIVTKSKVNREQERTMTDVSVWEEARQRDANIDAIQFDGKEDTTKAWVYNKFGKKVVREVREDLPPVLSTAAGGTASTRHCKWRPVIQRA